MNTALPIGLTLRTPCGFGGNRIASPGNGRA